MFRLILRFIIPAALLIVIGIFGARWIGVAVRGEILTWEHQHFTGGLRTSLWDAGHTIEFNAKTQVWQFHWNTPNRWAWLSTHDGESSIRVWDGWHTITLGREGTVNGYPVWLENGHLAWGSSSVGSSEYFTYEWDGEHTTIRTEGLPEENTRRQSAWSANGRLAWVGSGGGGSIGVHVWDGVNTTSIYGDFGHIIWVGWVQ